MTLTFAEWIFATLLALLTCTVGMGLGAIARAIENRK